MLFLHEGFLRFCNLGKRVGLGEQRFNLFTFDIADKVWENGLVPHGGPKYRYVLYPPMPLVTTAIIESGFCIIARFSLLTFQTAKQTEQRNISFLDQQSRTGMIWSTHRFTFSGLNGQHSKFGASAGT